MRQGFRLLLIATTAWLVGCAIGNEYAYDAKPANLAYQGSGSVASAVHDQRSYVKSGDKPPSFVGLQRNRFGIPFDVSTTSGQALDIDLGKTLSGALTSAGYRETGVAVTFKESGAAVRDRLLATRARRLVLLTVNEWKTDTRTKAALYFDLSLAIYDERGRLIARQSLKGRDEIGGKFFGNEAYVSDRAPQAFANKLEELFKTAEVIKALGGQTKPKP
ncbi:hypothetical protein [Nevskia sp.]|uniref:hypothetical protein n=1 Tax=Nevskia sp. TaxID=1929292 RepID=UPI0025FEA617|nr:hypothetical protein [Nevskia sp.]